MILVDANLLLYAYHPRSDQHRAASAWVEEAFSGPGPACLTWSTIWAFLRIATSRRIFEEPLSIREAGQAVASWLELPSVMILEPGERHWPLLQELLESAQASGPLVMDAALAALAIEHGATLCTSDRDFARFPGLETRYPLSD